MPSFLISLCHLGAPLPPNLPLYFQALNVELILSRDKRQKRQQNAFPEKFRSEKGKNIKRKKKSSRREEIKH